MQIDIRTLLSKLNPYSKNVMTLAAEQCVQQTHFNVEPEHLLFQLTLPSSLAPDLQIIFKHFEVKEDLVHRQVQQSLERFKRGNSRTPALSPLFSTLFQESWLMSSMLMGEQQIRSGTILLAFLETDSLRGLLIDSAPSLLEMPRERLKNEMPELLKVSSENFNNVIGIPNSDVISSPPNQGSESNLTNAKRLGEKSQMPHLFSNSSEHPSSSQALAQYTIDFTELARNARIDPIKGRDQEIRQIIDILLRRRQNNPILTGEAGVGKTAVVEGLAHKIIEGSVPPMLQGVRILALDLALLQAGAGMRGEFENRLKSVISEVRASLTPIIIFIDEAHQLIGAGGSEGQGDAANLLKPALARGELRTIAATTWTEYKKYVERDPALARRFQVVKIDEPTPEQAIHMLRGMVKTLELHHQVEILDEAVKDAVRLSHRYITGRQLPDKAISILDTACARVRIGQTGMPPQIQALEHSQSMLIENLRILRLKQARGEPADQAIASLEQELMLTQNKIKILCEKLTLERASVEEILKLRREISNSLNGSDPHASHLSEDSSLETQSEIGVSQTLQLQRLLKGLEAIQEDEPLVPVCVDSSSVANVISAWTGIPVGKMMVDEIHTVMHLQERLCQRVIGQDEALEMIAKRVRTYRAGLDDPSKPVGVFLLVGPSGVGKTETAHALADMLYGGERNMITINMSEFQEAHSVSNLKGAPPGYVGYGSGGLLTEAVRRRPYSVVLLDEMEKAHPDVLELFFQVFDKGSMEDGEGVTIDFKNTLILLTSNAAQEVITEACESETRPSTTTLTHKLRPVLLKQFSPAFLARLVLVPYYPLGEAHIKEIVQLKLTKLSERFRDHHNAVFTWSEEVNASICARCTEVDSGARNIDYILTQTILPQLSSQVLEQMSLVKSFNKVHMRVFEGQFEYEFSNLDGPRDQNTNLNAAPSGVFNEHVREV